MSTNCTLFTTNGSIAAVYSYYRFYDFRNLQSRDLPPFSSSSAVPVAKTVNNASWASDWSVRGQTTKPAVEGQLPMQFSPANVFIDDGAGQASTQPTVLTLLSTRHANHTQAAGEIQYAERNVTHISLRILARVTGAPGGVAGLFTYHNDTQESDMEILTRDPPTAMSFSNQPDAGGTSRFNASVPAWTDWNVYRLDWVAGRTAWYVNGQLAATTDINVPSAESGVILNMWGNGGNWSGNMTTGAHAVLQVQWVEMAFNSSVAPSANSTSGLQQRCSVDQSVGTPVIVSLAAGKFRSPWFLTLAALLCLHVIHFLI